MSRYQYICEVCGGVNMTYQATVQWDFELQTFVSCDTYDDGYCKDCEESREGIEMEGGNGE